MQLINEAICSDDYSAIRCDCRGAYKPTAITILLNFIVTNKSDVAFCFIMLLLNILQLYYEYSKTIDYYKHSLQMDWDRMKIAILNLILTICSIIHYFIWCIDYFTFISQDSWNQNLENIAYFFFFISSLIFSEIIILDDIDSFENQYGNNYQICIIIVRIINIVLSIYQFILLILNIALYNFCRERFNLMTRSRLFCLGFVLVLHTVLVIFYLPKRQKMQTRINIISKIIIFQILINMGLFCEIIYYALRWDTQMFSIFFYFNPSKCANDDQQCQRLISTSIQGENPQSFRHHFEWSICYFTLQILSNNIPRFFICYKITSFVKKRPSQLTKIFEELH